MHHVFVFFSNVVSARLLRGEKEMGEKRPAPLELLISNGVNEFWNVDCGMVCTSSMFE